MPNYIKWRTQQPGFIEDPVGHSLGTAEWLFKKEREVAWDGTFNMPVLPLATAGHKDSKHYFHG